MRYTKYLKYMTSNSGEYFSYEREGIKWENTSIYSPICYISNVRKYEPKYTKDTLYNNVTSSIIDDDEDEVGITIFLKPKKHNSLHCTTLPKHYSDTAFVDADKTYNVTNSPSYKLRWFKRYSVNNSCEMCGEDEACCLVHYKDPSHKSSDIKTLISDTITYLPKVIEEINKCIIVCLNCHRKIHSKIF